MKLNDIVEHAKGRRAKIYNRKPKNTIEPHKPQAPVGPMSEAEVTLKPLAGAQEVDVDGKAVGTATTPQAATAISDLAKKGEFTPATADNQQPAAMEDEVGTPYYVKLTGNGPVVKSGNGFTPIVASKIWDTMTPEIEEKARTQGFRKITLSVNGAMIPALEGGGKVIVGKTSYGTIANSQNEEHNHHGVDAHGDVGGDATDSFLDQIKLQPEDDIGHGNMYEMSRIKHLAGLKEADAPSTLAAPAPTAPVPADTDGPGYSFDSAKGFKDAISAEVGSADPELNAKLDQMIAAEADGTVDVDQTLYNILKEFNQLMPQMLQFVKDMIAKFTEISQGTEFLQASQADQQSLLQSIKDMQAMLPGLEKSVADLQTQFQQNEPMMQQNIKDRKLNTQMKGKPAPVVESADDQLLKQMLSIAGLR